MNHKELFIKSISLFSTCFLPPWTLLQTSHKSPHIHFQYFFNILNTISNFIQFSPCRSHLSNYYSSSTRHFNRKKSLNELGKMQTFLTHLEFCLFPPISRWLRFPTDSPLRITVKIQMNLKLLNSHRAHILAREAAKLMFAAHN